MGNLQRNFQLHISGQIRQKHQIRKGKAPIFRNTLRQNTPRCVIRAETSGRTLQKATPVHVMFYNLSDFAASGQPGQPDEVG